jgi:hypothetical protein
MKRSTIVALCLSLCCVAADNPTLPEVPDSPAKLIETLKAAGERYTVNTPRLDYVKASDIPYLVSLLNSEDPCAFVDLSASSIYSPGKSTVGHEAAYLIEGFYKRYYPTELTSQLHKPDIDAVKHWYQMWSHLKNVAKQSGARQRGTSVQPMKNPQQAGAQDEKQVQSLVPGRMVCSETCEQNLDFANGVHKCVACEKKCNLLHKYCQSCAGNLNRCEVCGASMVKTSRGGEEHPER